MIDYYFVVGEATIWKGANFFFFWLTGSFVIEQSNRLILSSFFFCATTEDVLSFSETLSRVRVVL
jgi:hypothetical protein